MTPAVTVLLPVFNAAPFLREAIDSVLAQSHPDFELLIIDDGSTDDTAKILASYPDPRIRVVSRANRGLIETLNEGLVLSRAPLIARFDGDDICLPHRLETQLRFMAANPRVVVLGSDVDYIDEEGSFVAYQPAPDGYAHEEILSHRFHKCPFLHPTVIFQRDAVLKAGGYPSNALTFEDWLLWLKLPAFGELQNLKEVLVKMRINAASVTIDEKWRGPKFLAIRLAALRRGEATVEDAEELRSIIRAQNTDAYKGASYHTFLAKKYLWSNSRPRLARKALRRAIRQYPRRGEPYFLWLVSFMPAALVSWLYRRMKKQTVS